MEIWSEAFFSYSMTMLVFFNTAFPSLVRALLLFHEKVLYLSKI